MFGFGKKQSTGEFLAAAGIYPAFERMAASCPGASYIFARTMLNAQTLMRGNLPDRNKRSLLDQALREGVPHAKADGGISLLAARVMRQSLDAKDAAARTTYAETFVAIARHGQQYRELQDADFMAPDDIDDEGLLIGMGGSCLGEIVEILEQDGAEQVNIDTIVATFDIRGEIRSGTLPVHIRHFEMILALQG